MIRRPLSEAVAPRHCHVEHGHAVCVFDAPHSRDVREQQSSWDATRISTFATPAAWRADGRSCTGTVPRPPPPSAFRSGLRRWHPTPAPTPGGAMAATAGGFGAFRASSAVTSSRRSASTKVLLANVAPPAGTRSTSVHPASERRNRTTAPASVERLTTPSASSTREPNRSPTSPRGASRAVRRQAPPARS